MTYLELKKKHRDEAERFPIFFAYNDVQFIRGMKSFGLTENDTDQIYKLPGGGFIKKSDSEEFHAMFERHVTEFEEAYKDDDFLFDAIRYELWNHEYCINRSSYKIMDELDLLDQVTDERVQRILKEAIKDYFEVS